MNLQAVTLVSLECPERLLATEVLLHDTEGMDLRVLKGTDWSKFRPRVICVEVSLVQTVGTGDQKVESVGDFLTSVRYKKHRVTVDFGVPLNEIYVSEI